MEIHVIEDHFRWSERGYLRKMSCLKHKALKPIIRYRTDIEGIQLLCPICGVSYKEIGSVEYERIQEEVESAKREFKDEQFIL